MDREDLLSHRIQRRAAGDGPVERHGHKVMTNGSGILLDIVILGLDPRICGRPHDADFWRSSCGYRYSG